MTKKLVIFFIFISLFTVKNVLAVENIDSDGDGINYNDESNVYFTDPNNKDTDNDGYSDKNELINGYSPLDSRKIKLEKSDFDNDGLSDRMELNFHTNLKNPDTDSDGYNDGEEIAKGFNPLKGNGEKLPKRITVNLDKQELSYYLGNVRLGSYKISSGKKGMYTPTGNYKVDGKHPRAWSRYGLWMPWWMSLSHGYFGIHELPEWPGGKKEGEDHLGTPVSHGCIRLGVGPAKILYDWTPIGTPVYIY